MSENYEDIDYKALPIKDKFLHAHMLELVHEAIDQDPNVLAFKFYGTPGDFIDRFTTEFGVRGSLISQTLSKILHKQGGLSEVFMQMQDCTPDQPDIARAAYEAVNHHIHEYWRGKFKPDPMPW